MMYFGFPLWGTRCVYFSFVYGKEWDETMYGFRTNGGNFSKGCFDASFYLWRFCFGFTHFR